MVGFDLMEHVMDKKFSLDHEDLAEALVNKKRYNRPEVKVFGGIKWLTQGSSGSCADGGSGSQKPSNASSRCT
jgi:hypothetical protein